MPENTPTRATVRNLIAQIERMHPLDRLEPGIAAGDLLPMLRLALRALDYEAASGEVTEEIMAAAWTAYCGSRGPGTAVAIRAVVDAVAPFLSAAARRKALEEAASVAYTTPEYVAGWGSDGAMIPGSPYDRGRFDAAAAIRALKKESV